MTSIFELAQFLADRDAAKGNFEPAQTYLDRAARQAVAGWTTLEEAEDDPGTRYDAWGNEIQPGVIFDAVRYLRHAPADNAQLRSACLAALPFVLDGQLVSHQNSPRDPRQVSRESVAVDIRHVTGGAAC